MPYSKNYPVAITLWVSLETRNKLSELNKKTGIAKANLVRGAIHILYDDYMAGKTITLPLRGELECKIACPPKTS